MNDNTPKKRPLDAENENECNRKRSKEEEEENEIDFAQILVDFQKEVEDEEFSLPFGPRPVRNFQSSMLPYERGTFVPSTRVTITSSERPSSSNTVLIPFQFVVTLLGQKLSSLWPGVNDLSRKIEVQKDLLLPLLKYYACGVTNIRPDRMMNLFFMNNDPNSKEKKIILVDPLSIPNYQKATLKTLFPDISENESAVLNYVLVLELLPMEITRSVTTPVDWKGTLQQPHLFVYKFKKESEENSLGREQTIFLPRSEDEIDKSNKCEGNKAEIESKKAYLLNLPVEIIEHIFSFLLIFDWSSMIKVCKHLYNVGFNSFVWSKWSLGLDFSEHPCINDLVISKIPQKVLSATKMMHISSSNSTLSKTSVKRFNKLEILWIHMSKHTPLEAFRDLTMAIVNNLPSLHTLMVVGEGTNSQHLVLFKLFGSQVKTLGINHGRTDGPLMKAISYCSKLQVLILPPISAEEETYIKRNLPSNCRICLIDFRISSIGGAYR